MSLHTIERAITTTYSDGGWPLGMLTGYPDGDGGFALEWVIVFAGSPSRTLMDMLHEGIEEAWRLGFAYIVWRVPHAFPGALALAEVGRRLGFVEQKRDERQAYYVRPKP